MEINNANSTSQSTATTTAQSAAQTNADTPEQTTETQVTQGDTVTISGEDAEAASTYDRPVVTIQTGGGTEQPPPDNK